MSKKFNSRLGGKVMLKKFNSIIIVLTMLLAMMAPASMASTETEEVIIYGSDARTLSSQLLLDTKADSETGYETARRFATTKGDTLPEEGVYVTYEFDLPADGIYRLDMIAGKYDHGYISTYSVKVDDKEYSAINATTIKNSAAAGTTGLLMEYTTNLYYNLKAGTHTFYFKPDYCTAQSRVYSFLNKASFVKATDSEIAQLSQISIEGRDAYTTNSSEFPNYTLNIYGDNSANDYRQGTTSIKISGSGAADNFPQNGIVISYEFDVMKDGIYELSSLTAGDVTHTHLSKYGISIDGGIVKKVYSASIESTTAHSTYDLLKVYTTNLRYYLTEGRHKFNFVIYEHNTARNGTYTYFDKATLNLIENPEDYNSVIYGQDLYVEKTSDLTVSLSRADMASNGKMVAFTAPVGTTVPKSIKYKFEIYDDGDYT